MLARPSFGLVVATLLALFPAGVPVEICFCFDAHEEACEHHGAAVADPHAAERCLERSRAPGARTDASPHERDAGTCRCILVEAPAASTPSAGPHGTADLVPVAAAEALVPREPPALRRRTEAVPETGPPRHLRLRVLLV